MASNSSSSNFLNTNWVLDSGASNHMCGARDMFVDYEHLSASMDITVAKAGIKMVVVGRGTVALNMRVGKRVFAARLENTLHVPELTRNLFSASSAMAKGMSIEMAGSGCTIKQGGTVVATGTKRGKLITLDIEDAPECHLAVSGELWHRRLGHASRHAVNELIRSGALGSKTKVCDTAGTCRVCALAKQTRAPFPKHEGEKH